MISKEEFQNLMVEIENARQKLAIAHLWRTYHKMHDVIREAGWEMATLLSGKGKDVSEGDNST